MERKSLYGASSSGIPKARPSAYSVNDSGIPRSSRPAGPSTGWARQSSGVGLPRAFGAPSAVKSTAGSARKSLYSSARKSHTPMSKVPSYNPSSAASSASRQSIGGQRPNVEDRPINEMSYHKHCFSKLNALLQELGQPAMPQRFLTSPSSSDIKRVLEFLFRELGIDLNQLVQPPKSWELELSAIVQSLGYRYTIAKKFIVASTSIHARGQLFGLLEWLVDSICYSKRSRADHILFLGDLIQDQPLNHRQEVFKIALCSDPVVREERLLHLEEAKYGTKEQFEEMRQREKALEQDIAKAEKEIEEVMERKRFITGLGIDSANHERYAKELTEQLEAQRETAEELQQQQRKLAETEALIQQAEAKKARIEEELDEQEFGQEDLKWARERQQQLKEEAERELKAIEEQKRSVRDIRLTAKQEEDKLFKMQSDVHSLLMSLKEAVLSPSIASYVQQVRVLLQSRKLEDATYFLIQPISLTPDAADKRIMLRDLVREYKMQLVQQTVALESSNMPGLEQQLKDLLSAMADKEKAIQKQKDRITELNLEIESDRQQAIADHARLKKEYEGNQTFLKELDQKLKKSESETADRVRKISELVAKEEAELNQLKKEQLEWLSEYTSGQRDIFSRIQEAVEQRILQVKPYVSNLAQEKTRQEKVIQRFHDKIARYKKSKLQKK